MRHFKFTKRRKILFSILIVFSAVLFLSLFYIEFGIFNSESSVNSDSERFSAMNPELKSSGDLYLYVEGNSKIKNYLIEELKKELGGKFSVYNYANLKEEFDGPVLAVSVLEKDMFYTPFYSNSESRVFSFYSLSGKTKYFKDFISSYYGAKEPAVIFNSTEGPQLIKKSELLAEQNIYGIFSINSARRNLANVIAERIAEDTFNK